MTRIELVKLHEMQDITIEHKLPNYNGNISYFIEAAGDIYRELCHDPADFGGYIAEKRMKLRKFFDLEEIRIREIFDVPNRYPDWHDQLDNYVVKVDDLYDETEKFDFGIYEKVGIYNTDIELDRKALMLSALEVILTICLYAEGEFVKHEVEKIIKETDEMISKPVAIPA